MSLTGTWQNSYGSVMSLTQFADGLVSGQYSSTTGSTGRYWVVGCADTSEPSATKGQAVSLTIFWRSIEPGTPDPSWHWVSGLGGQVVIDNGVSTLILLHALVATDDFPGLAPPGTWLDKLVYLPKTDIDAASVDALPAARPSAAGDPLDGHWVCEQDASLSLQLAVVDAAIGLVDGSLQRATGASRIWGFTDSFAASDSLPLQGVSLAVAVDPAAGQARCLAGRLDRARDRLEFTVFDSRGTAADASYVQTAVGALSFRRG